jgi:hypothetical protein
MALGKEGVAEDQKKEEGAVADPEREDQNNLVISSWYFAASA